MVTPEKTTTDETLYGNVIAEDVSLEDYLTHHAAHHCEWVEGKVIQLSPATSRHNAIIWYLKNMGEAYFEIRGG